MRYKQVRTRCAEAQFHGSLTCFSTSASESAISPDGRLTSRCQQQSRGNNGSEY